MVISRAPFRVSLLGGGTDFPEFFRRHGGAVLVTAIDRYSFVTANHVDTAIRDFAIRVSYSLNESTKTLDEIKHPVFRECLRSVGLTRDIELHAVAELPSFSG